MRQITRGYDEHGNPVLYFKVRNEAYRPRHAPPAVMLMLRLLLAMGGGCSVNDNGSGWAYIRPYSGNARLMLLRLVADAKAGEMVLQRGPSGRRSDFRSQDPMWTTKVMVAKYGEVADKPTRTPGSDREQAVGQALTIYRKTRKRSRIACSEAAYGAVLREVFALVDAIYREPAEPADK